MLRLPAAGVREWPAGLRLRLLTGGTPLLSSPLSTSSARVRPTLRRLRAPNASSGSSAQRRFYYVEGPPARSRWPRFALSTIIISGAIASAYWINRNTSTSTPDHSKFPASWISATNGLPPACAHEFLLAFSCVDGHAAVSPDPTKAVHHLTLGLQLLGDMHDRAWEQAHDVVKIVAAAAMQREDWGLACDVVAHAGDHLEKRAAANLEGVGGGGGSDARRESRRLFLQDVVAMKHAVFHIYRNSRRNQAVARPSAADVENLARVEDLLAQAVELLLKELPPSSEYAGYPEKLDFLNCKHRSMIFFDQATVMRRRGDPIAEVFYFMQSAYQIPENTKTTCLEVANAAHFIASICQNEVMQQLEAKRREQDTTTLLLAPLGQDIKTGEDLTHFSLEKMRSLSVMGLTACSMIWSAIAIDATVRAQPSAPQRLLSPKHDLFLRPRGSGTVSQKQQREEPPLLQVSVPDSSIMSTVTFPGIALDLDSIFVNSALIRAMGFSMASLPFKALADLRLALERAEAREGRFVQEKLQIEDLIRFINQQIELHGLTEENENKLLAQVK